MEEQHAPVTQGFTPINQPPKAVAPTTCFERPEQEKVSIGKASTVAPKPRKRRKSEITLSDLEIVKPPKRPRARRPRPSKVQEASTGPFCPATAQGSEQTGIRSRTDEPRVEPRVTSQNEDSIFDEALDSLPINELDASRSSLELINTADIAGVKSSHAKDFDCLSSQMHQTTSVRPKDESSGVNAGSISSHMDDEGFPASDQEDCFEVDRHGKRQCIAKNSDVLIYENIETLPQDPFADADLDIELSNIRIPSLKRNDVQPSPLTRRTRTPPTSPIPKAPITSHTSGQRVVRVKIISKGRETTATTVRKPLSPIPSPNTAPHQFLFGPDGSPIPVVRPPFPASVLPRSPVTGLSPTTVLRTCLRIGEALNAASSCLRNSVDALVELYCRIKYSDREPNGYKQYFEFVDLFKPDRSPILNGVYAVWKGVELWDFDSRAFLRDNGRGRIARVMGRIKRGEGGHVWEMTVLNIWEATWDDVGIVKGIVCA